MTEHTDTTLSKDILKSILETGLRGIFVFQGRLRGHFNSGFMNQLR